MKFSIIATLFLLTGLLVADSNTGIYFSFGSYSSKRFTDISTENLDKSYVSSPLNILVSLYRENAYDVTLDLTKDKYFLESDLIDHSRYGVGFSLGKVISIPIFSGGKKVFSPDFAFGGFVKMFITSKVDDSLSFNYGLYFSIKAKINVLAKHLKLNSVDLGYRVILPFSNSVYKTPFSIMDSSQSIFLGVSF
jgi:hypothetical protein